MNFRLLNTETFKPSLKAMKLPSLTQLGHWVPHLPLVLALLKKATQFAAAILNIALLFLFFSMSALHLKLPKRLIFFNYIYLLIGLLD